jgi:uncharacterized membrane protein
MNDVFDVLTLVTALGCGLAAGSLFAFSTFAMAGLVRLPPRDGLAAMQSINRTAVTPAFMTVLFGTALACLVLGVWAAMNADGRTAWALPGGALYLVGTIAVTMVKNVPLNDELAAVGPDPSGVAVWERYARVWRSWNHLRVAAALAAAGLLIVALTE